MIMMIMIIVNIHNDTYIEEQMFGDSAGQHPQPEAPGKQDKTQ